MQTAYLHVIIMLHTAFAAVFFFLHRQSPSPFARRFAWSWLIEAVRAAILWQVIGGTGSWAEQWYCLSDVLGFLANWYLLAGCAHLAEVKLPRWIGPIYFGAVLPLVVVNRFWMPDALGAYGIEASSAAFYSHMTYLIAMFLPVAFARFAVVYWLARVWKKSQLPGALIACVFCVPFALVALAVPFQDFYSYSPDWFAVLWCARVLGFSIGLVILMLNIQQAAAAKSEGSLVAAQSLANIGNWELDLSAGTATWSAEMYRLYGRDPSQGVLSYDEFLSVLHPEDREVFQRNEAMAMSERRSSLHEFRINRPDGSVRWIQGRNTPHFGTGGELVRVFGVEQDITERKRAEARMKAQHALTRVLAEADALEPTMRKILSIITPGLDACYAGWWIVDRSSRTLRCTEFWHLPGEALAAFADSSRTRTYSAEVGLPGRVLAEGKPVFVGPGDIHSPGIYPRREAATKAGINSGSAFPIVLRGEIFGVIEVFTAEILRADPELVTLFSDLGTQIAQFIERQRLEEQYRQSQKMEAVGTLAGGIAHDFNNILTAINGYCELAQMEAADNPAVLENLSAVQAGARRAVDLVRQIMAFSRQQGQQRTQVRIDEIAHEALNLLRATIPSTIEITTTVKEDIHAVFADPTSIHQIVVNLGTNAWHAMKDRPGRLDVSLENTHIDAEFARLHPTLKPGPYVRLSISDTGHGMDPSTIARIFEPFFTTKGPGEGTGLGLAVVHGIMKTHEGAILVYSRPGEGTKFDLYFPAHFGDDAPASEPQTAAALHGNGERILYVDDEKPLGQMGKKILEHFGYQVEIHSDAVAALEALRSRPDAYDLLITDLTMPVMTGLELTEAILLLRPNLPVILTSGYTATLSPDRLHAQGIREVLMKPHSFDSLGATVHRVLNRERSSRQHRHAHAGVERSVSP